MKRDYMTILALQHPVNPKQVKKRKDWTHVLASDGAAFTSPAIARHYMNTHGLKGTIKFVRPN